MSEELIYVKTPKGIDEISKRSHGLSPRARQALILLDGKRSIDEVAQMLSGTETLVLLDELFADGFIESLQSTPAVKVRVVEPAAAKPVAAKPAVSKPASNVERPQDDAARLEMAKNFMRNTVQSFLGGMGSGFISHINKCDSFEELRKNFGPWKEAIELSSEGRKQLLDLEQRLMILLS
jgi:hypothetical protein